MGNIFGGKAETPAPIPPAAPVEQATFKPGGTETDKTKIAKQAQGKKKLQVDLTGTSTAGLAIPTTTTTTA